MKISTKQIGDGILPNKYWVSIANDYYYDNDNCYDWISDLDLFVCKGKTIEVFNTYKEALSYCENELYLGMDYDDGEMNFTVNCIHIEDRISGQVYEKVKALNQATGNITELEFVDYSFTYKEMQKRGVAFR